MTENAAEAPRRDARREAVAALMRLAAAKRWHQIELPEIAAEAGLSLAELRNLFPSKTAILGALTRIADDAVLAGRADDLADEPYREKVFDLVMRRLDALAPYKAGLKAVAPVVRADPFLLAALNRGAVNSWRYLLASAGIPTEDALGTLRVQGAVLLMARVSEVWLRDDSPEQAKTMAALDRELKRAGQIMARAEDFHRLTAPLRGLAGVFCGRRPRMRRRERERGLPGEERDDYAPAI